MIDNCNFFSVFKKFMAINRILFILTSPIVLFYTSFKDRYKEKKMNKKDGFLSKYIKAYSDFKQKQVNVLDNKKKNLQIKLKNEVSKFQELLNIKESLKKEDERYDETYNSLIKILKSRGILFNIHNNNFQVREWDNLFIKNINGLYMFMNKSGDSLYVIEEKYNDVVKYIINNYSYSVIVTRIDINSIKVQVRILETA